MRKDLTTTMNNKTELNQIVTDLKFVLRILQSAENHHILLGLATTLLDDILVGTRRLEWKCAEAVEQENQRIKPNE